MITREEIRQLAQFESPKGSAVSFYFQPQTPQDKSHRQETILIKDMVREALRRAERNGNNLPLRDDLQRILQVAEGLHGNHSRGKVIFACGGLGVWRELDVPPRLGRSQVIVNSRFHLKPMVAARTGIRRASLSWRKTRCSPSPTLSSDHYPRSAKATATADTMPGIASVTWITKWPPTTSYLPNRFTCS
jgi:hypothetical protein